ncbi:MAG TPA: hypothetical protein VMW56_08325, partial [Candidatus Margulisiibacteriota bacterium]|nr:hypothetical protein [Candidatus Margulisiibacteriota bacterium]
MRFRYIPFIIAVGMAILIRPVTVRAGVISWKSAASGNWSDKTKWDSGTVPGPGDDANITVAGTYTVTLDAHSEIASLTLGGSTGTQTLSNAQFNLTLDGDSTIGARGVYTHGGGTLAGAGTLTVDGALNMNGGTLSGAGATNIAAGGTFSIGGTMNILQSINNAGTATWGSGGINCGNGAIVTNQSGGVFSIQSDQFWGPFGGQACQFVNASGGTVSKTSTGGTTTFSNIPFGNSGAVTVSTGVLLLGGGGTSSGSVNVATGARVEFNAGTYTLNAGAAFTGAGTMRVSGATLTVAGDAGVTNLEMTAGTLNGGANLTVSGSCAWSGGTMSGTGLTIIPMGATLTISGSVNLSRSLHSAG